MAPRSPFQNARVYVTAPLKGRFFIPLALVRILKISIILPNIFTEAPLASAWHCALGSHPHLSLCASGVRRDVRDTSYFFRNTVYRNQFVGGAHLWRHNKISFPAPGTSRRRRDYLFVCKRRSKIQ